MDFSFYQKRFHALPAQIDTTPEKDLNIAVVIPSYKEPNLVKAIGSLQNCEKPTKGVEIIVVFNSSERSTREDFQEHQASKNALTKYLSENTLRYPVHLIEAEQLPAKQAGVGWARKIGMDEAARRFSHVNNDGVISCFDGDSTVEPHYLVELEKAFLNPNIMGASLYFEHPLHGGHFDPSVYHYILQYELHLRFYRQGLRYAGHPFSYHTIGSSMAVRTSAYLKQGGMNRRKAGEDFYFLQKIIPMGGFVEINKTKVIPSPRPSDRVPFGTGKAITDLLQQQEETYLSYDERVFERLRLLLTQLTKGPEKVFSLPPLDQAFLEQHHYRKEWQRLKKNTASKKQFLEQFYRYFNGFLCLKYVHFITKKEFPRKPIIPEARAFLQRLGVDREIATDYELIAAYRALDRKA